MTVGALITPDTPNPNWPEKSIQRFRLSMDQQDLKKELWKLRIENPDEFDSGSYGLILVDGEGNRYSASLRDDMTAV